MAAPPTHPSILYLALRTPPRVPFLRAYAPPTTMQCSICERHNSRITCATCAQSSVWPLRTEFLFKTTERDVASEKVQEYIEGQGGRMDAAVARAEELRVRLERTRAESAAMREALQAEGARMEKLRAENEERRKKLDARNAATLNRDAQLEAMRADIKRLNHKWRVLYQRTGEARGFLCREAAGLVNLRLKRRKSGKHEYMIAGVQIPNLLTDLNVLPPTTINVALEHLAHLLVLVAHYLGLKLPAEIQLPEQGRPFPTIRGVLSNRHVTSRPPRIDSALSTLAQENPSAHSKFIEGVSMLAWDIAWICYSQSLLINELEDACNIGYNMWKLLVAKDSTAATNPSFGKTSHSTIHGNLTYAKYEPLMGGFKLRVSVVADKIRSTLQGETIVSGWDLVSDADAGGAPPPPSCGSLGDGESSASPRDRTASTTGGGKWTRIKSRAERGDVG